MKPYLERELHVRSAGGISKMELQDMTRSLIQSSNASNRTLALLEQERTKYQFFASMSKEIQFEYSGSSDVLTVSDWGAEQLGVSSVLVHPGRNKEIYKIFTREDFVKYEVQSEQRQTRGSYCYLYLPHQCTGQPEVVQGYSQAALGDGGNKRADWDDR